MWGLGAEASLPGRFLAVLHHQGVMSVPFRTQCLQVTETHSSKLGPATEFIMTEENTSGKLRALLLPALKGWRLGSKASVETSLSRQ